MALFVLSDSACESFRKAQKEEMVGLAYRLTNGAGESTIACTGGRSVWVPWFIARDPLNVVFRCVCRSDCFFTALGLLL